MHAPVIARMQINKVYERTIPMLEFDQITTNLKEVNAIDKRLEKHNKNNLKKDLEDTPPAG